MILFNTAVNEPILIILTVFFAITSAITVFDVRLIQAKKRGELPGEPMLPSWVGIITWLHYGLNAVIFLLNWKYGILLIVIKFVLSVLPVLETIGNILMSPFKKRVK